MFSNFSLVEELFKTPNDVFIKLSLRQNGSKVGDSAYRGVAGSKAFLG